MQTVKNTPKQKRLLQEQADQHRAEVLMKTFSEITSEYEKLTDEVSEKTKPFIDECERQMKPITALYEERFATMKASMEAAKKELIEIGERQKKSRLFGTDGNWTFEGLMHYLHIKQETVPVFGKDFSLDKFIKKAGEYVDVKFKIADLKKALSDGDQRSKFVKLDFDLGFNKVVELKKRKE
jgi:hypothetical protein